MNNQNTSNIKLIFWLTTGLAIVLLIAAVMYSDKQKKLTASLSSSIENNEPLIESSGEEGHVRGDFNAPVTIVEFSDFQCPFCQRFHPTVKRAVQDYQGQLKWVYKHFPLDQIHSQARPAAEASECAGEQNKFWEFADSLFENQSRLGATLYKELASQLGLDVVQFEDCVSSRKYKNKVEADYQEGIRLGVKGTPGNFINGQAVPGAVPYEQLKLTIDSLLEK